MVLEQPALEQARRAEAELSSGHDRGPLHGVPVSLKDLIDTAGTHTTAASRLWRDRVPATSATVARRLEQAGAVLIGKCNLLEFAYGIVHPDYGQCNNAWDIRRTSGGSIRIPAAYCGVVGLKPTYGRVSLHGICPLSTSLDHAVDYLRAHAYCRQLRDDMLNALRTVDVLIGPTVAWAAPAEDPPIGDGQGATEARRTGPYNLTGLPAISVPCGFNS